MKEIISLYFYIGQRIKKARNELLITQDELSRSLNCARTSLVHWEEGKNRISIEDIYKIGKILGKPIMYFLPASMTERLGKTKNQAFVDFLAKDNENND